jgi:hypothetical protein
VTLHLHFMAMWLVGDQINTFTRESHVIKLQHALTKQYTTSHDRERLMMRRMNV